MTPAPRVIPQAPSAPIAVRPHWEAPRRSARMVGRTRAIPSSGSTSVASWAAGTDPPPEPSAAEAGDAWLGELKACLEFHRDHNAGGVAVRQVVLTGPRVGA